MIRHEKNVAKTEDHLRERVVRLIRDVSRCREERNQLDLYENPYIVMDDQDITTPATSMSQFLGYVCDALPMGELYLFGGVLRDVAMYGRSGFESDFDLVVDGDWTHLIDYLESLGASRNRFGGYRLHAGGWPVDIWEARQTWAIREGLVPYHGIESLTRTTILNWDAILMNWRTREIVCRQDYFADIQEHLMHVVLEENPNPLGAAVRAFRHLCLNDVEKLTIEARRYLGNAARRYSPEVIIGTEAANYNGRVIDPEVLRLFARLDTSSVSSTRHQFEESSSRRVKEIEWSLQPLLI